MKPVTRTLLVVCLAILSACASLQPDHTAKSELSTSGLPITEHCDHWLSSLARAIESYTFFDPTLVRIQNNLILRSNRLLASYNLAQLPDEARQQWFEHSFDLGAKATEREFLRLPHEVQSRFLEASPIPGMSSIKPSLTLCFQHLALPELKPEDYAVPDSYSTWLRVAGLYSLTSRLALSSIAEYHRAMTELYHKGQSTSFTKANLYLPPQPSSSPLDTSIEIDSLGWPRLSHEQQQHLLYAHAPRLLVEYDSEADLVGSAQLIRSDPPKIKIDGNTPVIYTFISYTRWHDKVLVQLNYAFWFSARPPQSNLDLYAGDLDGVIWRVTLDDSLRPVLYDSIHQCGCYHKLYLPQATHVDLASFTDEKPLAFKLRQNPTGATSLTVKLNAKEHYVIDVATSVPVTQITDLQQRPYQLQPYNNLLSLPLVGGQGRDSLFGEDGIIEQSDRLERFFLWPLGVPAAGSMRQRGLHAIAFIGRRHFDEPFLLETFKLSVDYPE